MKKYNCSDYSEAYLMPSKSKGFIKLAIDFLQKPENNKKFDSIAFTGNSGACLAIIIAHTLNKELIMVRKSMDCHSSFKVEGYSSSKRYLIIDDFISMGSTVTKIQKEIHKSLPKTKCVGVLEVCRLELETIGLSFNWNSIVKRI